MLEYVDIWRQIYVSVILLEFTTYTDINVKMTRIGY